MTEEEAKEWARTLTNDELYEVLFYADTDGEAFKAAAIEQGRRIPNRGLGIQK